MDTGGLDTRRLEARILEAWRLQGLQAKAWRLGVIAGWLVLVIGCVPTRSTLREVGGLHHKLATAKARAIYEC